MEKYSIKNNDLSVTISSLGAELKSIQYQDIEFLWQGNPEFWKRSSPVLFPIVGRLLDNEYYYEEKNYSLSQHGFARDNDFELVEKSDTEILFKLSQNKDTLEKYPFDFDLYIGYKLCESSIEVSWKVVNPNNKDMLFQIGAHPAFNFLNGSEIIIDSETNIYELNGTPYIQGVKEKQEIGSILINDETFVNDAIVLDNIDHVILQDDQKSVQVKCDGFPFIGLWTSVTNGKNAPFICLEPWHGIADCVFHNKNLREKKGVNVLRPQEVFETSYEIIVNKK